MKSVSLSEIKKELHTLSLAKVIEVCLRLSKYKKENKELLTYLLFNSADENNYCLTIKGMVDDQFASLPRSNLYQTVKGLRKILRATNRFIKYSGLKQTEIELLLHFLVKLKKEEGKVKNSPVMIKLYATQLSKIQKAIASLHEDLQYDYNLEIENL